jgi:taurine dioxygenase
VPNVVQSLTARGALERGLDVVKNCISIVPIAGALGAEITGVDLSAQLSEETIDQIKSALTEHLVIFFRDQTLTRQQHKAFTSCFGELHRHPVIKGPPGEPDLLVLQNDEARRAQTDAWHSDVSSDEYPPMGSVLYAHEIPDAGGDTMWMNAYLAYEALSAPMRTYLNGLTATHSIEHLFGMKSLVNLGAAEATAIRERLKPVHHPVVRTHPWSGRKSLYVNSSFTRSIDGIPKAESDAVLRFLYAHMASPNFTCRFRWRKGSVAFWDNRCTQHYALNDYWPHKRHMERFTVVGEKPV